MYLEYLITAISLIPIYIFLLKGLNLKFSTALYIYFYRSIFSLFYIFYASNDFADANTYIRGNALDSELIGQGIVLRIVWPVWEDSELYSRSFILNIPVIVNSVDPISKLEGKSI